MKSALSTTKRAFRGAFILSMSLTSVGASRAPAVQTTQIAGVSIPQTLLARNAGAFVASVEPDFLFNHSLRTYVLGSIAMRARGASFDPETAYVAALFHDLGLVSKIASPQGSFEIDGANQAEAFILEKGGTAEQARIAWNAVAMHDLGGSYQSHQSNEALLLGAGASADVDGPDAAIFPGSVVAEVVRALPRLQFKKRFIAAAVDHCRRKPVSQIGWLGPLCQRVSPSADHDSVENEIMSAAFTE